MLKKLFLLCVMSVILLVSFWLSFTTTLHSGRTRVPDVIGKSMEEAERILKEQQLTFVLDTTLAEPSKIPAGSVCVQDPKPGRQAVSGSPVHIGISLGTPQIAVPDLAGKNVQEAKFALMKRHLTLESIAQIPFPADPGTIISHYPPAGALVTRDAPVHILLSSPTSPLAFVMPNCLGQSYSRIKHAFELRGIMISGIREKSVAYYAEGTILHQFPLPGHAVRPGDVVSFTINTEETHG